MRRAKPTSRRALWVLWLCALTVLAKSSMPFLANASAERQGRALVEVCTVYGVATVAVDAKRHGPPEPVAGHAAEHCALTALAAWAAGEPPAERVAAASAALLPVLPEAATASLADEAAQWAARLRHGPPRTS